MKEKMEILDKNSCISCEWHVMGYCEHDIGGGDCDDKSQFFCFYYESRINQARQNRRKRWKQ
jgi:hypothetical protein